MWMRCFLTATLLLLTSTAAMAGDTPPPTAEYNNVPPGLLLTPAQRIDIKSPHTQKPAEDAGSDTLDPQILTHSLKVLEAAPQPDSDTKIISMSQIEDAYAKGKYADIIKPLEDNVDQNEPQAALLLGIMYDAGQGVPANAVRASELYARAAEANVSQAQHRLALQYYQGRGVAKDVLRAMMWLHIACATYKDGPQKERALADKKNLDAAMTRKDRETALFMAREWMTKKGIVHLLDAQQAQP